MRGFLILCILLGFPILEFLATARMAEAIGWWLLAWLLADVVIGMALIREAGMTIPVRLIAALQAGVRLNLAVLSSFREVFAGLLLIFPGVLSDLLALILLLLPGPKAGPKTDGAIDGQWRRIDEP